MEEENPYLEARASSIEGTGCFARRRIPAGTPAGSYRLRHDGHWKSGWTRAITPYTGVSRTFRVD